MRSLFFYFIIIIINSGAQGRLGCVGGEYGGTQFKKSKW